MKLLLIDDHALFREGLSLLISVRLARPEAPLTVLQAGDLHEAASLLVAHPDLSLVLLDLGLAHQQGLGTLHQWRDMAPQVPVVVLSADDRSETILSAIDAGALGFIPKTAHADAMQSAIRHVLAGGVYLPPLPPLPRSHAEPAPPSFVDTVTGEDGLLDEMGLSARQLDVLRLLVEGKSNKDMSRMLNLADSTVKTHMASIFKKLQVSSRTQAVVAVAQAGMNLRTPALGAPGQDKGGISSAS